jgi:hypothetical protein
MMVDARGKLTLHNEVVQAGKIIIYQLLKALEIWGRGICGGALVLGRPTLCLVIKSQRVPPSSQSFHMAGS